MSNKPVRVRFAPSPTGYLHIGSARTALFTWLYARANDGAFILRIEDTDQNRFVEDSLQQMMRSLRWLGLEWDEGPDKGGNYGPYVQSERLEHYQKWANWLVEQGKAYRCYATPQELARAKELAEKAGKRGAGYERMHRFLSDEERARLHDERGGKYVIRFAMPLEGTTEVYDKVRGKIVFDNSELNDAVLLKSDGFPTYHLAVVVDDYLMQISHVTRTTEWLPSFPLHARIYEAFGWEQPEWVHLPVILCPGGGKMSKRKPCKSEEGETIPVSVDEYIDAGYEPEAVVNWLTNLGWSFGDDREFFYVHETIQRFNFDRINPAPAKVPLSKLKALNGEHIRAMSDERIAQELHPMLEAVYGEIDTNKLLGIIPHIKARINPMRDAVPLVKFLFAKEFVPATTEQMIPRKMDAAQVKTILQRCYDVLNGLEDFSAATQDKHIRALVEETGLKTGQVFSPLRWATIAQEVSPPLFESMEVLGKEVSLARLRDAIQRL